MGPSVLSAPCNQFEFVFEANTPTCINLVGRKARSTTFDHAGSICFVSGYLFKGEHLMKISHAERV